MNATPKKAAVQPPDWLHGQPIFGHRYTVAFVVGGESKLHGQTDDLDQARNWAKNEREFTGNGTQIWECVKRDPFLKDWRQGWKLVN